jgi:hypothetical protein
VFSGNEKRQRVAIQIIFATVFMISLLIYEKGWLTNFTVDWAGLGWMDGMVGWLVGWLGYENWTHDHVWV